MTDVWGSGPLPKGQNGASKKVGSLQVTEKRQTRSLAIPGPFPLFLDWCYLVAANLLCKSFWKVRIGVRIIFRSEWRTANRFEKCVSYCESFSKVRVVLQIVLRSAYRPANRFQKCVTECESFQNCKSWVQIVWKVRIVMTQQFSPPWVNPYQYFKN